jgi:hypothetical protein
MRENLAIEPGLTLTRLRARLLFLSDWCWSRYSEGFEGGGIAGAGNCSAHVSLWPVSSVSGPGRARIAESLHGTTSVGGSGYRTVFKITFLARWDPLRTELRRPKRLRAGEDIRRSCSRGDRVWVRDRNRFAECHQKLVWITAPAAWALSRMGIFHIPSLNCTYRRQARGFSSGPLKAESHHAITDPEHVEVWLNSSLAMLQLPAAVPPYGAVHALHAAQCLLCVCVAAVPHARSLRLTARGNVIATVDLSTI